ncbi:MAG TPA: hypothetical protein VFA07_00890 [Chthonomonadaceae bacterium]|nr:hypothetical protein [Chthonomonadaceae bacterium]
MAFDLGSLAGALVGGLVGGLFSGVVSPLLTARLREWDRRLDIYKILYPSELEAAKGINDAVSDMLEFLQQFVFDFKDRKEGEELEYWFDKSTKRGMNWNLWQHAKECFLGLIFMI